MGVIADGLIKRIADCDVEIARIRTNAQADMQRLQQQKAVLQEASALLVANPSAEDVITQLKTMGVS